MRRVTRAMRLFLAVQYRSGFVQVYFGLALFTVILVRGFVPASFHRLVVPALLLGEYGTMGVFMVAAQSYLARGERSTLALSVTPLTSFERVASLVLSSGLVAVAAGVFVFAGIVGLDWRVALLVPPLLATTVLSGSVGLVIASRYSEFTRFLMGAIPVVTVFSLPFLSLFGLVPRLTFSWLPWDAALFSFANLAADVPSAGLYVVLSAQLFLFALIALRWAERVEVV